MRSKGVLLSLALGAMTLAGCLAPPSQASRVTDAARELNLATRFGRMDIALSHTANGARDAFLDRRGQWGKHLRIVDVELAGLAMKDEHQATVQVDVAWVRVNDENLRTTRVAQVWRDDEGWQLIREQRLAGDLGLFGEPIPVTASEARDVQFPSRTIR
ncbi:MAG: hypothetical protein KC776_07685 [Myxococcales bacterium]|nr:hypothetical protein [Myxococcales bacterium]MCB9583485.1 hypothetical protein [Polyangiaceae bacterium]